MISINSDLLARVTGDNREKPAHTPSELLEIIYSHFLPLKESQNTADNYLYESIYEGIQQIASAQGINLRFESSPEKHSVLECLKIVALGWDDIISKSLSENARLSCLNARYKIESGSIRVWAKYEVIHTNLFSQQTHFSIFNLNTSLIDKNLGEIMKSTNPKVYK